MSRKDVRTLRDEAGQAATEGKHRRALECYVELEQREPTEPNWPKRAAEIYRRLGKNREAVAAYDRAAERYAQGGFLVQSIAVSKIVLQIDPQHEATKRRLATISEQQDGVKSQAGALADRHRGNAAVDGSRGPGSPKRTRPTTPPPALRAQATPGAPVAPEAPAATVAPIAASTSAPRWSPTSTPRAVAPVAAPVAPRMTAPAATPAALQVAAPAAAPAAPRVTSPAATAPPAAAARSVLPMRSRRVRAADEPLAPPTSAIGLPDEYDDGSDDTDAQPTTLSVDVEPVGTDRVPIIVADHDYAYNDDDAPNVFDELEALDALDPNQGQVVPAPDEDYDYDAGNSAADVYQLHDLSDEELSLDLGALSDAPPATTTGPIVLDRGAPLDSVALAGVMPGAQAARRGDGSTSGVIVIPLDDDEPYDAMASLEISAVTIGPDGELAAVIPLDSEVEPEELAVEDLEDVEDSVELGEPRAYSVSAQRALTATPLFAGLPPAALEQLIDRLALVELSGGDVLFHQGDVGETLYVVVDGEVAVLAEGPPQLEIARLGAGAFFGEVALVTDQPRSATIMATESTQLFAIDREVVRELITRYPEVLKVVLRFLRERLVDGLIQTHPLFQPYGDAERRDLVSRFRFLEIEAGATILAAGTRTAGLYALLAGHVEVRKDDVVLGSLGPGDLFGEISVLTGAPSDVTIAAGPRCLALCLPSNHFREIIMTHPLVLSYMSDLVDELQRVGPARRRQRVTLV